MAYGKKVWIFPDAELPPVGVNLIPGHESVIITNVSDQVANVKFTLLYTDKEPVSFTTQVEAMRVRCLRTNKECDFGEFTAKFDEQYPEQIEKIDECLYKLQKFVVRRWLLDEGKRVDMMTVRLRGLFK